MSTRPSVTKKDSISRTKNSISRNKYSISKANSANKTSDGNTENKKKVHRHGRSEYHCLDDVCILVRVPSSATFISRLSGMEPTGNVSDASFELYARQAEEQRRTMSRTQESVVSSSGTPSSGRSDNDNEYDKFGYDIEEGPEGPEEPEIPEDTGFEPTGDCKEFVDTITFAKEFVNDIIFESEAGVAAQLPPTPPEKEESRTDKDGISDYMQSFRESTDFAYIETKRSFSSWPTIETFNIETGAYKIDEYLASFETEEDWMYVIYYQGTEETPCSDMYRYQAIFSLPTWRYPIAQATASLYFTIEVCKVKPRHCSVDVTFKYETFGQARKPGVMDFQEKWLHHILDSKIKLFKTVTY